MSFISVVATLKYITVMTDGKVSGSEKEESDCQKFKVISPKQFIAITGNKNVSDGIYKYVSYSEYYYNLFQVGDHLREELKKKADPNTQKVNIVIGGIYENSVFFQVFNNYDPTDIKTGPQGECNLIFLSSPNINKEIWGNIFEDELSKIDIDNVDEVLRIQGEMNDKISEIDDTVNKNKYCDKFIL